MSTDTPLPVAAEATATSPTDIRLLAHQDAELFDFQHALLHHCGGRGSGKSKINWAHFLIRSERAVDQPYGLFASTDLQVETFIGLITEVVDYLGIEHCYETEAPMEWRLRWARDGVIVPPRRLRNQKFWIWDDGTHIFRCSMINNAYTRAKSLDLMFALIEEATEPGVTRNAIRTIIGCVRCGLGKKDASGESECKRRGHLHQTVVKYNVPLHDPGHWIYREVEELKAKETLRLHEGKKPFFRLIESGTRDNPHTGEEYDERLRAAWDAETYEQQTSGKLIRRTSALSYYAFSEHNILSSLTYDARRPLHLWFDFNHRPAVAGWGHDLRLDEVPSIDHSTRGRYFGIHGELFSGADTMFTEQVAHALLEDPTKNLAREEARCSDCKVRECSSKMRDHMQTVHGFLCTRCSWSETVNGVMRYCSGKTVDYEAQRSYLHVPANWRGLINHRSHIYVYGDASGKATHSDSYIKGGNLAILKEVFFANLPDERVHFRFKESNPPITLRVLAVNRRLRDANGKHQTFVAPWCTAHIDDFREVVPDPKTEHPKKETYDEKRRLQSDYWMRTHASDAFGYEEDYRFPAIIPRAGQLPPGEETYDYGPLAASWDGP